MSEAHVLWSAIREKIASVEVDADALVDGCPLCSTSEEDMAAIIEPLIAHYLKEWMRQSCIAINNEQMKSGGVRLHPNAMLRAVLDMTEWPKTE